MQRRSSFTCLSRKHLPSERVQIVWHYQVGRRIERHFLALIRFNLPALQWQLKTLSMNSLPTRLCFHNFAMIRTWTYLYIPVISLHKDDAVESISHLFSFICDWVDFLTFAETTFLSWVSCLTGFATNWTNCSIRAKLCSSVEFANLVLEECR